MSIVHRLRYSVQHTHFIKRKMIVSLLTYKKGLITDRSGHNMALE